MFSSKLADFFCLHRKFLLYNLILRNLKIRYRKSLLGMLWTVLIPAGSAVIYYFVFQFVLKVRIENYLLFIISGMIPWTFFATTLGTGLEVILGNYGLLNKVPLPPQSLVLSEALTHFLNFVLSLPVIVVIFAVTMEVPAWTVLQYFVLMGLLLLQAYAIGLFFGLIYIYFRDLKYVIQLIIQFWFYLTPVMYKIDMIPEKYRDLIYLNPVGTIFSGFTKATVLKEWLSPLEWAAAFGWTALAVLVSVLILNKLRHNIIEIL